MKEIIKDIINIIKIFFVMWFFILLQTYLRNGELNFLMLKGMLKGMIDYFIPYQLPCIIFLYYWGKYNMDKYKK